MNWLIVLDVALLILATLRVTRIFTTDSIGQWWFYGPLYKKIYGKGIRDGHQPGYAKYVEGLTCPFCIGFWVGCVGLLSLWLVGGPGDAAAWWRWLAAAFALNWVVGNVAARVDN